MKDRIEINGVWYVKEDTIQESKSDGIVEFDVEGFQYQGVVWEFDDFCFDVTRSVPDGENERFNTPMIKVTIKKGHRKDWKEDTIDNDRFMKGVFNNEPESIETVEEDFGKDAVDPLRFVIKGLLDLGWL